MYKFYEVLGATLAGLDRTRKPLRRLIPKLSDLLSNPANRLAENEVTIRAAPPYGATTFVGLFTAGLLPFFMGESVGLDLQMHRGLFFMAWLFTSLVFGLAVARLITRRKLVLQPLGVEFHDRKGRFLCPWSLFCVHGVAIRVNESLIAIPIEPKSLPLVEAHYRWGEIAYGHDACSDSVQLKPEEGKALMKDIYLADGVNLGKLILDLGERLAASP